MREFKMQGLDHNGQPSNVVIWVDAENEDDARAKIEPHVKSGTWPEVSQFVFVKS